MGGKVDKAITGSLAGKLFGRKDINKDGVLTGTEVGKLAKFDADKDGKVTRDEFDAGMKAERDKRTLAKAEKSFSRLDLNDDAVLSGTEAKRFAAYDSDKDGKVTLDEFKAGKLGKTSEPPEAEDSANPPGGGTTSTEAPSAGGPGAPADGAAPSGSTPPSSDPAEPSDPAAPDSDKAEDKKPDQKKNIPIPSKFAAFARRDINNDGVLTGNEIKKGIADFDKDGNKEITKDEFLAGRKEDLKDLRDRRREERFGRADVNDDGELSGTETKKIERYDADKDGKVSAEEFKAGRADDWKARMDKLAERRFAKADINKDGVLTGTETKKYEAHDKDGNKEITKDEFKAGLAEDRKKRRDEAILGK